MTGLREEDISAVKAYIAERISAQHSMDYNLEIVMREAAVRIVEICYAYRRNPRTFRYEDLPPGARKDIDAVIEWLREIIDSYFQTLALAGHEERDKVILPYIYRARDGMTFQERLSDYLDKYRTELLVLIGAGMTLGIGRKELADSIGRNIKRPWNNPELAEEVTPVSYGKGRTNVMYAAIGALTRHGIAEGWQKNWDDATKERGCLGWYVMRGSTYPCDLCDDNCGFHSVEDGTGLPVHLSCCCIAVPVYNSKDMM